MDPLKNVLRALADPTRCKILELLHEGSRSVNELAQHFSMSRPAVSKHLSILREAEVVRSRRQGRQQIYDLDAAPLDHVREWLGRFDTGGGEQQPEAPQPASTRRSRRSAAPRDDWRSW